MMTLTETLETAEAIVEEVLPHADGIVLDIGKVNDFLMALKEAKDTVAELEADSSFLDALYAAGLDNWEGFEIAQNAEDEKERSTF